MCLMIYIWSETNWNGDVFLFKFSIFGKIKSVDETF